MWRVMRWRKVWASSALCFSVCSWRSWGAGAWLATLLASTLWAAWVFFVEQPVAQQWAGAAAVLLGLLINQAGALRTLARSWWWLRA